LQREEPLIHILQPQLSKLLKGKFVKSEVIGLALKSKGLSAVDFKNPESHADDSSLVIGFLTK